MNDFIGIGTTATSGSAITVLQLSRAVVFSAPEEELDINMADLLQRKILPGDNATYKLLRGKNSGRKQNSFNYSDDFFNSVGGNI